MMGQGVPFLFLALEMGSERILERMIGAQTGCNAVRFRKRDDPEDLIGRCRLFSDAHGRKEAYFADEPGLSFDRLRSLASEAVIKLGIKALFVDYWQLITGQNRGQSGAEHLTGIAQWLAEFAAKQQVVVLIASQTNRDGYGYGSDGLAKACDWLGRLHKVEAKDHVDGIYESVWIEVLHNRDGSDRNIGSEEEPAFRISKHGPVLRDELISYARS